MRIEHVAMYVTDLEAAREFFVTYLSGRDYGVKSRETNEYTATME